MRVYARSTPKGVNVMTLKLFLWMNGLSDSDFADATNCIMPNSSNAHSGGVAVLAESEEEAVNLIMKHTRNVDIREKKIEEYEAIDTRPIVIPLDQKGVVIYCDGDC